MLDRKFTALSSLLACAALGSGTAFGNGITVTILHSFTGEVAGSSDGAFPTGALFQGQDGNLYGVASAAGEPGSNTFGMQYSTGVHDLLAPGAIFQVSLQGSEVDFYSFGFANPFDNMFISTVGLFYGGLIQGSDGNFYGEEPQGCGGIYQLTPAGVLTDLYLSPQVTPPGDNFVCVSVVEPGLLQGSDGNIYATTSGGNAEGEPIIDPDGDESDDSGGIGAVNDPSSVLQIPRSGVPNGASPVAVASFPVAGQVSVAPSSATPLNTTLIQGRDGNFYETISAGSALGNGNPAILQITPGGTVNVLYTFADVNQTASQLILANDGNLYGTTSAGGATSTSCPMGCGTVFRLTLSGAFTTLYSFGASPTDGQTPAGALIQASDGNLYGLTTAGGTGTSGVGINARMCPTTGCGTLFRITTSGAESVLYSFGSTALDGALPIGALVQATDGNLYGVTQFGGIEQLGTVFKAALTDN